MTLTDEQIEAAWAAIVGSSVADVCYIARIVRADLKNAIIAARQQPLATPAGWFVREDPGHEWQFVDQDPKNCIDLHYWEKQALYTAPPAPPALEWQEVIPAAFRFDRRVPTGAFRLR